MTERDQRGMTERQRRVTTKTGQRGMTLVELIVAFTILALLSTLAVPLARYRVKRDRERDLRYALREIRGAIDRYKDASDQQKIKFLRRIPIDPITGKAEWGKRSSQDDPKSNTWGGQNVFDVYSTSMDRARDGTPYSEWQ